MDVNTGASPAPADSSPAQGQTGSQQGDVQGAQPAGALNTDTALPQTIPYARFKEINDAKNALEEKYKPFDGKAELLQTYEQFDQLLNGRPELMGLLQVALTQPQVAAQIFQQLGIGQNQQGQQQQQQDGSNQTVSQLVLMTYTNEFERLASDAKIPQELVPDYFEMTKSELLKLNPDPLRRINIQDLRTAFTKATERARKFTAPYQQQKAGDQNLPPSSSANGAPPVAGKPNFGSQSERGAWLADQLKAGRGFI